MNPLEKLKAQLGDLQNQIDAIEAKVETDERERTEAEAKEILDLIAKQDGIQTQIDAEIAMAARAPEPQTAAQAGVVVAGPAAEASPYRNVGEYLYDLVGSAKNIAQGRPALTRVVNYQDQVMAAATGAGEAIPSDGGFLVGTDFSTDIMKRAYDNNQVINRCTRRTISGPANSIELDAVDETSRVAGSKWGGVRFYWFAEGGAMTASKPKTRKIKLELNEGGVLVYASDTLLADAPLFSQVLNDAVPDVIGANVQGAIINGTGTGQPLGILNSGAIVSQAAETGQGAATIVYENVLKMVSRIWGSMSSYAWLYNQEIIPQLGLMNVAVGTGGAPVFLPGGGVGSSATGALPMSLFTMPMIEIEQASALGTSGDLMLVNLNDYIVAEKGGVQSAMSIHVEFLTNQTVFRWVLRVDGQPTWNSPLTPEKGSATRGPFITLATRS